MSGSLLGTVLAMLEALPARAGEEAHGGHGEPHAIPWGTLFFTAVNFSLFLLLLGRAVLPAVRTWAISRRDRIVDELQKAAHARAEAERLKAEWEERLGRLEEELAAIRDEALADAQRERERILEAAQAMAAAIAADAERAAAQEARRATAELREEVARHAAELAREAIRKHLTEADQKRLLDDFVRGVRA
jgi:F-type H+-transporting ATPase subunit b